MLDAQVFLQLHPIPHGEHSLSQSQKRKTFFVKGTYLTENTQPGNSGCYGNWDDASTHLHTHSLTHSHQGYYIR